MIQEPCYTISTSNCSRPIEKSVFILHVNSMKHLLRILFIGILIAFGVGFYIRAQEDLLIGERIVGVTVLFSSFVFMPLFLYHRWKGKRLKDYTLTKENLRRMRKLRGESPENEKS